MVPVPPRLFPKFSTGYGSGLRPGMPVNRQVPEPLTVSFGTKPFSSRAMRTKTLKVDPPERPTPLVAMLNLPLSVSDPNPGPPTMARIASVVGSTDTTRPVARRVPPGLGLARAGQESGRDQVDIPAI